MKNSNASIHHHYWQQLMRNRELYKQLASFDVVPDLQFDQNHISWDSFNQLILAILETSIKKTQLLEIAASLSQATHGPLGLAILSAATVGEALEILASHMASRQTVFSLNLIKTNRGARLLFEANVERDELYEMFEHGSMLTISSFIQNIASPLPEQSMKVCSCATTLEFIDVLTSLYSDIGVDCLSFHQKQPELIFTNQCLAIPSAFADRTTCQTNLIKCYKDKLEEAKDNRDIQQKINNVLDDFFAIRELEHSNDLASSAAPTTESVARQLNVSTRTLHRQLGEKNTTFKNLWVNKRKMRAEKLLLESDFSIASIAALVGYTDTANFVRAFKQWHNKTPTQWQQDQKA